MKADIILNSYLLTKSTIVCKFFLKNWISKFFASDFEGKKFNSSSLKKFFITPNFFFSE